MTMHKSTCVSTYVASSLAALVGTDIKVGTGRGPPRPDRFELENVPESFDLSMIPEYMAAYGGLDRHMISPTAPITTDNHQAKLYSGRSRRLHGVVTISRSGRRVLVDVSRLNC